MQVDEDKGSGVQVISRVAAILRTLGEHPNGLSLGEIASNVALPKSTVKRLVSALESEQLIQTFGAGGISFGAGLLKLIVSANVDAIKAITPWLQILSDRMQETVVLSRANKLQLVVLHRIIADRQLQVIPRLGAGDLLLCTSSAGRALLALESNDNVCQLLQQSSENCVDINIERLLCQLDEIREKGFSLDHGEIMEGITTLAIALDTIFGRFAISIPVPSFRFEAQEKEYLEHLLEFQSQIGRALAI
ncbi:helix-turn-helix domain-containing protein (plasmid) [Pseudomonas luteola]|uniref:IclR family transcriptional regulator n=1 Tax=Pseudomonas luteola TaxID=47886 RepID=UPI0038908047